MSLGAGTSPVFQGKPLENRSKSSKKDQKKEQKPWKTIGLRGREALRSVLVDAIIASWAEHFVGNVTRP